MSKEKKQELKKAQPARALNPFDEMEQMFDQYLRGGWLRPWRFDWPALREAAMPELRFPKVDVVDREDEVVVKAEVPGVDKKDLDVSVSDDSVTIKGTTSHEEKEEKGDYHRCEISRGSFSRTIALPATVDGAKAKADFKDGMLELTLPKITKAKRHSVKVD
ncbi:MAG: Hsp20/alpha crystallin family protein [Pseudomonadota bacterium]